MMKMPIDIDAMIDVAHAPIWVRILLWFCPAQVAQVNGWMVEVTYKTLFGTAYFLSACVTLHHHHHHSSFITHHSNITHHSKERSDK